MTTTQELLESSFELNLSNYGPEDVERLNDWAIKAHNALEAAQAEIKVQTRAADHWMAEANKSHNLTVTQQAEIERLNGYVQKANMDVTAACVERDKALARLAESEAQNLMARQIILEHGEGVVGASPQQSPLLQFCTCEDCKPMECEGCRINRERRELLPAPGEAAREYMTGYSDGREWAGATNQAQPSQAGELNDAKRLDWIRDQLFEHKWNGVVGKGCAVQWVVAPDFRFKQRELTDDSGIAAGDFRRAIDAAINAKEHPNG